MPGLTESSDVHTHYMPLLPLFGSRICLMIRIACGVCDRSADRGRGGAGCCTSLLPSLLRLLTVSSVSCATSRRCRPVVSRPSSARRRHNVTNGLSSASLYHITLLSPVHATPAIRVSSVTCRTCPSSYRHYQPPLLGLSAASYVTLPLPHLMSRYRAAFHV